jgi:hypothetical protein
MKEKTYQVIYYYSDNSYSKKGLFSKKEMSKLLDGYLHFKQFDHSFGSIKKVDSILVLVDGKIETVEEFISRNPIVKRKTRLKK